MNMSVSELFLYIDLCPAGGRLVSSSSVPGFPPKVTTVDRLNGGSSRHSCEPKISAPEKTAIRGEKKKQLFHGAKLGWI